MYTRQTYYQPSSITIAYDAHGTLGGASTWARGGNFSIGFASGAVASFMTTTADVLTQNLCEAWQVTCMVAAGTLSGGVTASMAGGSFWEGVCNGLICSGLNHALHMIAGPDDPPDSNEISVDRSKGNNSGELLAALGSGWAIAAAEPTFLGEVIMGIASIGLGGYYAIKELSQSQLIKKMNNEIARIQERIEGPNGFVYEQRAKADGLYPNVRGGAVFLKQGEVWKIGETTKGFNRYTRKYLESKGKGLEIHPVYYGTQKTNTNSRKANDKCLFHK